MRKNILPIGIISFISSLNVAFAADFFIADFEDNGAFSHTGSWTLAPLFQNNFGEGDLFEIVRGTSHSGDYSLRFKYHGKNDYCNTCGLTTFKHKTGLDGVDYFVADSGADLVLEANAAFGKSLYNLTDGVSQWDIIAVESSGTNKNDKLTLKLNRAGIKGKGTGVFNGGDTIQIARRCGLDGKFAGSIDRRDDCDRAISYFEGVSGSQQPGESIFRRMYIRFDTTDPAGNTKLRYWKVLDNTAKGTVYLNHGTTAKTLPDGYPLVLLQELIPNPVNDTDPPNAVFNPASTSNKAIFKPGLSMPADTSMDRTVWYYIEEEFKASSSPGAQDGEYRLWYSKAGEEPTSENDPPLLEVTGFNLPVVSSTSLWGNFQHSKHTRGQVYIDDISITNNWHGKVVATPTNTKPTTPPDTSQ